MLSLEKSQARDFDYQYSSLYFTRLNFIASIYKKKFESYEFKKIVDLSSSICVYVIGTLYIDDPRKPSILRELGEVSKTENFEKKYFLEDDTGRVTLKFNNEQCTLINGTVVGLYGIESGSFFKVLEVLKLGVPSPRYLHHSHKGKKILFISGLNISDPSCELLFNFISEKIDDSFIIYLLCDCVGRGCRIEEQSKKFGQEVIRYDTSSILKLDKQLFKVANKCASILIIPGHEDPTSALLPHLPISHIFFPCAFKTGKLSLPSNPSHLLLFEGFDVLTCPPIIISDLFSYYKNQFLDVTDALLYLLENRHLSPSCPDTICILHFKIFRV